MAGKGRGKGHLELIRVLLADDFPVMLEGLSVVLGREPDVKIVGSAGNGQQAVDLYALRRPHVVLMDLRMPGMDGIGATAAICARDPEARVIILSAYAGEEDVFRALKAGARGYLLKDIPSAEIVRAVRQVRGGGECIPAEVAGKLARRVASSGLTPREVEVLQFVAQGKSNKQIGTQFDLTEGTVKIHVSNILRKMQATDRTQAATLAIRRGLVRLR